MWGGNFHHDSKSKDWKYIQFVLDYRDALVYKQVLKDNEFVYNAEETFLPRLQTNMKL